MTRHSNEGLEGSNPSTSNLPTPKAQGLEGSHILYMASNLPTLAKGGVGTTDDAVSNLCDLKTRINAGIAYLQKHSNDSARFAKGRSRLVRLCVEEYRPALTDLTAFTPRRDLHQRRMHLKRRLHVGMTRDSEKAADRFIELLTQYEVLTDALRDDAVATTMRRIVRLEAIAA